MASHHVSLYTVFLSKSFFQVFFFFMQNVIPGDPASNSPSCCSLPCSLLQFNSLLSLPIGSIQLKEFTHFSLTMLLLIERKVLVAWKQEMLLLAIVVGSPGTKSNRFTKKYLLAKMYTVTQDANYTEKLFWGVRTL